MVFEQRQFPKKVASPRLSQQCFKQRGVAFSPERILRGISLCQGALVTATDFFFPIEKQKNRAVVEMLDSGVRQARAAMKDLSLLPLHPPPVNWGH